MRIWQVLPSRSFQFLSVFNCRRVFKSLFVFFVPSLIFATQADLHEISTPECLRRIRSLALEVIAVPSRKFVERTDHEFPRQPFQDLRYQILMREMLKELKSIPAQEDYQFFSKIISGVSLRFEESPSRVFWDFLKGSIETPHHPSIWFSYGLQVPFWERVIRTGHWDAEGIKTAFHIFENAVMAYRQRALTAPLRSKSKLYLRIANRYARLGYQLASRFKIAEAKKRFRSLEYP